MRWGTLYRDGLCLAAISPTGIYIYWDILGWLGWGLNRNSSLDYQLKYKIVNKKMGYKCREGRHSSAEDDLERGLSAQQNESCDWAQVVWIRANYQNCCEDLIDCRLAGNRAWLKRDDNQVCDREMKTRRAKGGICHQLHLWNSTMCITLVASGEWTILVVRLHQMHLFMAGMSQNELCWSGWGDNGGENLPTAAP